MTDEEIRELEEKNMEEIAELKEDFKKWRTKRKGKGEANNA